MATAQHGGELNPVLHTAQGATHKRQAEVKFVAQVQERRDKTYSAVCDAHEQDEPVAGVLGLGTSVN